MSQDHDPKAPRRRMDISSPTEEAASKEARIEAERFRAEIARAIAEHTGYLKEYGCLADAVRAWQRTPARIKMDHGARQSDPAEACRETVNILDG